MKRFVSYLYSIYNNQKIHNSGFARIELRTGRNRIDIHLQESGYSGRTGTVYLFVRKEENIQGIPIGDIIFRNNQADFRYEQPDENIGQTSWQIMQMNGIVVLMDDKITFLSQWDEKPVDTSRFEIWHEEDGAAGKKEQPDDVKGTQNVITENHAGQAVQKDHGNSRETDKISDSDKQQTDQDSMDDVQEEPVAKDETTQHNYGHTHFNSSDTHTRSEQKTENAEDEMAVEQSKEDSMKNVHTKQSRQYRTNYVRRNHAPQGSGNNAQVYSDARRDHTRQGTGNNAQIYSGMEPYPNSLPVQNVKDAVNTMQQSQNMRQAKSRQQGQHIPQEMHMSNEQMIQQQDQHIPQPIQQQNQHIPQPIQQQDQHIPQPIQQQSQHMPQTEMMQQDQHIPQTQTIQMQNETMRRSCHMRQNPVQQQNMPYSQTKIQKQSGQNEEDMRGSNPLPSNIHTAEIQPQPGMHQWEQTWRYMLRIYPVMNQFAEKDNVLCVRIEIKDVRLLPEKYWSVVNNSFLLHGFFNYRYLIFGRIGQNWMIGVPGIYQNQEHAMASIFGFPDFLAQEKKNERGEQPGYWYRILEI